MTIPPGFSFFRVAGQKLDRPDVLGLQSLGTLDNVELHFLVLMEGLEAVHIDGGIVHEDVLAIFLLDKAEALGFVKPFDSSPCHTTRLLKKL